MPHRLTICTSLVLLSGWASADVWAQTRGTTGQNGQGSTGSSMFGSSGTGGSSLGSTGLGGTGGQGGFGQTGQGGLGQGQTGFGQNRNTGLTGQNQNNGFLGVNNNPNNFLGRNSQGQPGNVSGQTGNLGRGNRGGGQRQLDSNLANMLNGGQQGNGGQSNQQPVIRPRQKVAFEYPQPKLEAVVASTQSRLQKLAIRYPRLSDVQLAQDSDGTVILRGSAPSEADAKVAESMIRLEPGVRKIRNELTFPPPRPDSE